MAKGERDYAAQPVADVLGLQAIIDGLASDLQDVRAGRISPSDAMARAALAKQIFNGARLFLVAHRELNRAAPPPPPPPRPERIVGGLVE